MLVENGLTTLVQGRSVTDVDAEIVFVMPETMTGSAGFSATVDGKTMLLTMRLAADRAADSLAKVSLKPTELERAAVWAA